MEDEAVVTVPVSRPRTSSLFTALVVTNTATLILGMLVYGEPFRFWEFAYSYLGGTLTTNGRPNGPARLVFGLGMVGCGFIMFAISANFRLDTRASHPRLKARLCFFAGLGYFIIIYPYNVHNTIHSVGSALVFGCLWGVASLLLIEGRTIRSRRRFVACQLSLQGSILAYAVTWVLGAQMAQVIQKAAVFALIIVLRVASSVPREVPAPGGGLAADKG